MEEENKKEEKKKMSVAKKIFLTILAFLILVIIVLVGLVVAVLARFNHYALDINNLGIVHNVVHSNQVRNVAVFGIDLDGLSDVIMVLSLDYRNSEIRLISFMRDSIVRIDRSDGPVFTRQNHAWAYGGPELAIRTLNTNYDLDIQDFMAINFEGMENVINRLGGITIDVSHYTETELNALMRRMRISPVEWSRILENNEKLTFNGEQAVFYARIRNIGDGDARRTSRHRVIMEQVILQLFDLSHAELVSLAWEFMPYVKTSFEIGDIVDTISDYNQFRHAGIFEFMYPTLYAEAIIREMSLVRPVTLESNVIELMKFIYDVEDYQASDALREISQAIEVLQ